MLGKVVEYGTGAQGAQLRRFWAGSNDYLEFHVDFMGGISSAKLDDLRYNLGREVGWYVCFDEAGAIPCEHFHNPIMANTAARCTLLCRTREPLGRTTRKAKHWPSTEYEASR